MKLLLLILLTQFKPVWYGNGYAHMNIHVVEHNLSGDTIAVFNRGLCCGFAAITADYFNIIASADDGSGNGFTQGDSIEFVAASGLPLTATYFNDLLHWVSLYEQNGSAFVRLWADVVTKYHVPDARQMVIKPGVYDLQGRKITIKKKGVIYIINGQKIVVL